MLKRILIALVAVSIVVLLAILVRESRSVSAQFYIDYSNYVSVLRQGQRDYETLSDTLSVAVRQASPVPETVQTLTRRMQQGIDTLRAPAASIRSNDVTTAARNYAVAVDDVIARVAEFNQAQQLLTRQANVLRVDAPGVVRFLRDRERGEFSQILFGLTVELLDYATGQSDLPVEELQQRVDAVLAQAESGRPAVGLDKVLDAASSTIALRAQSAQAMSALGAGAYPASAQQLYDAVASMNAAVTSRADRARLLLAAVCVLLILGITMIGLRLRKSNATLADTNAELEQFNVSLEERVTERTRELSSAYEELKESQAQLVQAEKMSSLGELVAGISHEINTPLWYLLSNTTLIKERLASFNRFVEITDDMLKMLKAGGSDKQAFVDQLRKLDHALNRDGLRDDLEESNDLLDDSVEGLEQLSEMAQSLKDFSRLDRAAVDAVNLNDGLEKTLVIARNVLKSGVQVEKNLGELPDVSCSPSQINQVLLNLIKNASDAMDRTGVLTLSTWADDEWVHLSVADTGSGIDAETLGKIRDPFFTTKEVGKGTGLGLSISQKIIDAHNGRLDIVSTVGEGSTFTISLPVGVVAGQSDMARELADLELFEKEHGPAFNDSQGDEENDLIYASGKTA